MAHLAAAAAGQWEGWRLPPLQPLLHIRVLIWAGAAFVIAVAATRGAMARRTQTA